MYVRVRPMAREGLAVLALCAATPPPAAADPALITYRASIGSTRVGSAALAWAVEGGRYDLSVSGILASPGKNGPARAMAQASGALGDGALRPERYDARLGAGAAARRLTLTFAGGVASVLGESALRGEARRPLATRHRRAVLDPASAWLVPAPPPDQAPLSACLRLQPVFDGAARYELSLFPVRTEPVDFDGVRTTALVCRLRLTPVAGHRGGARAAARHGTIWLAPLGRGEVLAPVRIEFDFRFGRLVVEADNARSLGARLLRARR
jgi:hypothetical protein